MGVSKVDYNGETLIDLTGDTVTPETLAEGATAHDMAGNPITGTMKQNSGGGEAVTEVFFVDGTFDMTTLTFATSVPYDDIVSAVQNNKYIVARADTLIGTTVTNIIFLPLSGHGIYSSVASFDGMLQVNGSDIGLTAGQILLAVTVVVCADGEVITKIKVVSTTEIK